MLESLWFFEEVCSRMSRNTRDWKSMQHIAFIIARLLCWPLASNQQVALQEIAI